MCRITQCFRIVLMGIYVYMNMYAYVNMYVLICVCVCVCMCMELYMCICIWLLYSEENNDYFDSNKFVIAVYRGLASPALLMSVE